MVTVLSIDEQVAAMKATWPQFAARRIDRRAQSARWVGSMRPQYVNYSLDIRYQVGSFPEVRVISPELGVVCGRGRNPTLRLWPAIFSGEIDVFPSERRNMGQEIGR